MAPRKTKAPRKGKTKARKSTRSRASTSTRKQAVETSKEVGRPTVYDPDYARQAGILCEHGATDLEIADFFQVSVRTVYRWKGEHEEFCQALRAGKAEADARVERSLYHAAVGYSHDAVKILQHNGAPVIVPYREQVPPDTAAAKFWLINRAGWKDKVEHTGTIEHSFARVLADIDGSETGIGPAG